jgi:hypothetical protein
MALAQAGSSVISKSQATIAKQHVSERNNSHFDLAAMLLPAAPSLMRPWRT